MTEAEIQAYMRGFENGVRHGFVWAELADGETTAAAQVRRAMHVPTAERTAAGLKGAATRKRRELGLDKPEEGPLQRGRPAGTGVRQAKILAQLKEGPGEGMTTGDLAEAMKCDIRYLYRALPTMLKLGQVKANVTYPPFSEIGGDEGSTGVLEPGTDIEGQRHLLGVMPRWQAA